MNKVQDKIKKFGHWIWQECRDWKTVVLLVTVIAIVYSPVWGGYLLYHIFSWKWCLVMASACLAFWAGPFTPFFPVCIGITLFIKNRIIMRKCKGQKKITQRTADYSEKITFCKLFVLFVAGSIAGVVIEGVYCLITKGHWESHVVSVSAPYNILYGFGAVLFYIGAVKLKGKKTFIQAGIMMTAATLLELLCGLCLKYGLGMRAWNYDNSFLNYKGLICIGFSFVWGVAAFIFCKTYPRLNKILAHCRGRNWNIVCSSFAVLIALDLVTTGASITRWSERHYGITAQTQIQKEIDAEAPDSYMKTRFMDWKFCE